MTKITIKYKNGFIVEFKAEGHTGYAENGKDILCASVSSIMQAAVLGLKKVAKLSFSYKTNAKTGYLKCSLNEEYIKQNTKWQNGQVILNTMVCGIKDVASEFKDYIKVEEIRDVY